VYHNVSYFLGEFERKKEKSQEGDIYGVWFGDTHFTRAFTYSYAPPRETFLQCFYTQGQKDKNPKFYGPSPL